METKAVNKFLPDNHITSPLTSVLLLKSVHRETIFNRNDLLELKTITNLIIPTDEELDNHDWIKYLTNANIAITGWTTPPLTDEILDKCKNLQLVAHTGGSLRGILPESIWRRNLRITNVREVIAEAVAEFIILQALTWLKNLYKYVQLMKPGNDTWGYDAFTRYPTHLLKNQIIGAVGAGKVGRAAIALFKAFDCKILLYDPYVTPAEISDMGVIACDLETLFTSANIVSLHAPLLKGTRGMIGAKQLALLQENALLINSARGALVDEAALVNELETGRIYAALDVFTFEPLASTHRLRQLPNVLLSPHVAGLTTETLNLQGKSILQDINRFNEKIPMLNELFEKNYEYLA